MRHTGILTSITVKTISIIVKTTSIIGKTISIILPCIFILTGCSKKIYVPVESVRTEYREADTTAIYNRLKSMFELSRQRETSSDSVIDRQKETVVLKENGDTARHDRIRIIYKFSNREKELEQKVRSQDSILSDMRTRLASAATDTIKVLDPYPVEKKKSFVEKAKEGLGELALFLMLVVLMVIILRYLRK